MLASCTAEPSTHLQQIIDKAHSAACDRFGTIHLPLVMTTRSRKSDHIWAARGSWGVQRLQWLALRRPFPCRQATDSFPLPCNTQKGAWWHSYQYKQPCDPEIREGKTSAAVTLATTLAVATPSLVTAAPTALLAALALPLLSWHMHTLITSHRSNC